MRKLIFTITISALWLGLGAIAVQAAVLNKVIERTYEMNGDAVHVTETTTASITDPNFYIPAGSKELFTVFDPILMDTDAAAKIQKTLPTIKVVDESGNSVAFTTEISGQDINVSVPRSYDIVYGRSHALTITYDSYSLSTRNGALYDLYIPSFSKDFHFSDDTTTRTYNTHVLVLKSLGELNLVLPNKQPVESGDRWQVDYSQAELTDTLSWIQIGTTQYYQFEINQPYPASINIPLFYNTFSVTLPRDVNAGTVTQTMLYTDISPEPDSVITDDNGNLIANFVVPANSGGTINIKGYATTTHNLQLNIKNSGNISDIPAAIINANTSPTQYWEVSAPEIQAAAKQLKGDSNNVYDLVAKTYQFVVDKINYDDVKRFGINERQGALATLLKGSGVCMEYSDLFIALMRAEGIPARGAFGYGYDSRSTNGEDAAHQWAEVYIPNLQAWIGVDTTWGEAGPAVIGGDLNHFYKYVASVDPNTPSPVEVSYFGNLGKVNDESFQINSLESAPQVQGRTQSELLAQYPTKSALTAKIESITKGITLATKTIDSKFAAFLIAQGANAENSAMIQASIYSLFIVSGGALILHFALRKRKTRLAAASPTA